MIAQPAQALQRQRSRLAISRSTSIHWTFLLFLSALAFGQIVRVSTFLRRRDPSAYAEVDPSNVISIALVGIAAFTLFTESGTLSVTRLLRSQLRFFIAYVAFCGLSALWSANPVYGLYRAFELLVNLILFDQIFALLRKSNHALTYLLVFTLATSLAGLGFYLRTGQESFHTNTYTCVAAMGLAMTLTAFFLLRITSIMVLCFAVLFLAGLALGTSSGSNVAALAGVGVIAVLRIAPKNWISAACFLIFLAWIAFIAFEEPILTALFPGKETAGIYSIGYRLGFWDKYINGFLSRPLLGYGFPSGEKEAQMFGFALTSSSHNMLLSIAINTGIVGLLLFAIFLWHVFRSAMRGYQSGRGQDGIIITVLVVACTNAMTYPVLGSQWDYPTSIVLAVLAYGVHFGSAGASSPPPRAARRPPHRQRTNE